MNKNSVSRNTKFIFFSSCIFILTLSVCLLFITGKTDAKDFYISPNGSDSNIGSSDAHWKTFNHAMKFLQPGDTLYLKDGIYYQTLQVMVSGTSGNPITFKAENDGRAIIDGKNVRKTISIRTVNGADRFHDLAFQGIVARNSNSSVVDIVSSERITFRRVSAYNANPYANYLVWNVNKSNNVLLEDCAASGTGRSMFSAFESHYVIFRRCWGMWTEHNSSDASGYCLYLYGSDNSIMENCIGLRDSVDTDRTTCFGVITNRWNRTASSNNRLFGNVAYNMPNHYGLQTHSATKNLINNKYVNNAFINCRGGFANRAGDNMVIDHMTVANTDNLNQFSTNPYNEYDNGVKLKANADFRMNTTLKNSSFYLGQKGINPGTATIQLKDGSTTRSVLNHSYNNIFAIKNPKDGGNGVGEINIAPSYSVSTYGKGAYLMRPENLKGRGKNGEDIGAEVLYCYYDGVLTNVPLWPWPMENRIFAETGVSVTWEANGGLWKVLDGVYSGSPLNKPPLTKDDTATTNKGTSINIDVLANDKAASHMIEPTTVKIVNSPTNGNAKINGDSTIKYSPATGYVGFDTFTYTVNDTLGTTSNVTNVKVTVNNSGSSSFFDDLRYSRATCPSAYG